MENENKPEICFQGFFDKWSNNELGVLSEIIDGDRGVNYPSSIDFYKDEHTLFLNASNVTKNGFNFQENQYITLEKSNMLGNGKLNADDIVLTSRGSVGHIAWYTDNISKIYPNVRINSGMLILRSKKGTQPIYLSQFLKSSLGENAIDKITFGSAQPQLTKKEVFKLNVSIPLDSNEQKLIGKFFENIDKLITEHQQKHSKLKSLKKAMLDKMFPKEGQVVPEIRFKGFEGEWEEKRLGELGKATGGTSIESEFVKQGKYKVISIGSYSEQSTYIDQGLRVNSSEKIQQRILNKNDLTMVLNDKTASGNILGRVLLIEEDKKFVYNQRTQRVEPDLNNYNSNFLYQLFNAPNIRDRILKASQGNTQIYVNWSAIKELKYLVPSLKEQKHLANYFKNLDELIDKHNIQITKLQNIKKALLSKMFV